MKTTVIEFWGSPGSGKSTFAADCFVEAAKRGLNCHLVTEFIKDHAVRGLPIEELDQPWITGEQTRRESGCYGKFDFVFTDSPVLLPAFFSHYYDEDDLGLASFICRWENRASAKYNIERIRVFLPIVEEWFKQTGRYESYEDSHKMSLKLKTWIHKVTGTDPLFITTPCRDKVEFVTKYLINPKDKTEDRKDVLPGLFAERRELRERRDFLVDKPFFLFRKHLAKEVASIDRRLNDIANQISDIASCKD